MSQSFHGLNRNKIGVTLDLKEPPHREALLQLAAKSDLVLENFTAGTLDKLGLGFDDLAQSNPAIVLLSLAGFGASSRLGQMRAYGLVLSAMSGLEGKVTDPRDNSFLGSPTFVASDPNAATFGLLTAIAAVLEARRTGQGAHVEISQLEAAAFIGQDDDVELNALAEELGISGPPLAGECSILPIAGGQHLCVDWRGRISTEMFTDLSVRVAELDAAQACQACESVGARAVKVIEQTTEFGAGTSALDTLVPTIHPVTGAENIVASPWWIDGRRPPLRKTAPTLGEGNTYVLGRLLGWPQESIEAITDPGRDVSGNANGEGSNG
jgi:crotonobetainyl-CoA:carnitine CoA-transferase CaiB-like acyl-CoA transferase